MPEFYKRGSYLICASQSEGGPLPVLEALACGIPVITTDVGWCKYLIKDGENGYKFDGTPADLSRKIDKIMKKNYKEMSLSAAKSVRRYSWEKIIGQHERMFGLVAK
jgi:glycosyltransferase involved in cell wall biosynthesis